MTDRVGVVLAILLARAAAITGNDGDRDWVPANVTATEATWQALHRNLDHDQPDDQVADHFRIALLTHGPQLLTTENPR